MFKDNFIAEYSIFVEKCLFFSKKQVSAKYIQILMSTPQIQCKFQILTRITPQPDLSWYWFLCISLSIFTLNKVIENPSKTHVEFDFNSQNLFCVYSNLSSYTSRFFLKIFEFFYCHKHFYVDKMEWKLFLIF